MKHLNLVLPVIVTPVALVHFFSVVGCGNNESKIDIIKDLDKDTTDEYAPRTETTPFNIELNKVYSFNVDASICPEESFVDAEPVMSFFIYKKEQELIIPVDIKITKVQVEDIVFEQVETPYDLSAGKYCYYDKTLIFMNSSSPDSSFTMSVNLRFPSNKGESVVARWYSRT